MNNYHKKYYSFSFTLPAVIIFAIFFILPNIAGLGLGFTDWNIFFFNEINFNGIENFVTLFTERNFWLSIRNTFHFAFLTVIGKNILGLLLALLVNKQSKFNTAIRAIIFMPITISTLVLAIMFLSIYNPSHGLLNQFLDLFHLSSFKNDWLFNVKYSMNSISFMEIWQQTGFSMAIFLAGLQSIPKEYYEAAKVDGASPFHQFFHITLPLIIQSINVTLMLSIISGIKVFAQVYGTTNGGPADQTQVLSTYLYKSYGNGYLGYSAAVGLFMTILIVILTFGVVSFLRKKEVQL